MSYDHIRDFIAVLEQQGELVRIKAEVDAVLEIPEITDRVSKEQGTANKALLFERVKGSRFPVLTNAFGSMKRMCLALEVRNLDEIGLRIREIIDPVNLFPGPGPGPTKYAWDLRSNDWWRSGGGNTASDRGRSASAQRAEHDCRMSPDPHCSSC